jgi:cystathionine beta-synthase
MKYANTVLDLIGNTPLIKLNRVAAGVKPLVLAKLEQMNPGGSVKDRIAIYMIEQAEKEGKLRRGGTIVEPTSGNTGVGLAQVAALKGYKCVFVMPDKQSQEKVKLLKAYGAEVVITPTAVAKESPESYYSVAERLAREIPNAFQPDQYSNPMNPYTHYVTTGPEIWEQTEGRIDVFVCGMGTGGTISGVGKYLKEKNPNIKIVGVDPEGSLYTGTEARPYKIEGIGEDFIPATIDLDIIDHMVTVSDRESFIMARRLAREEGLLLGGSSGSAVYGALKYARTMNEGETMVILIPDGGLKYLSRFFSDDYMKEHGFWDDSERLSVGELLAQKPSVNNGTSVLTVSADEPVTSAIETMKRYSISQLPVMEGSEIVGTLQETVLMNRIFEDPGSLNSRVRDVMGEALPTIGRDTNLNWVYQMLLDGRSAVLVVDEKSKPCGIVTKIDLIEHITRSRDSVRSAVN